MRGILALVAIGCLACAPAQGQTSDDHSGSAASEDLTPAVAKVVALAKANFSKTVVYSEFDDRNPNGKKTLGIGIVGQPPETSKLMMYQGPDLGDYMGALQDEAIASGKDGWREILIVVDNGTVTVQRGPSPGTIEGFNTRLHAAVDRAFAKHS